MKFASKIFAFIGLIVSVSFASSKSEDLLDSIIDKFDRLYKSSSAKGVMKMHIKTPHWERTLKMETWSLGTEKSLVKILYPKKERGVGTLKIENKMWNYLPKTGKVMKIPPSMMMSSWMGSDFTNDDLVREYTFEQDYNLELMTPKEKSDSLYYIKGKPKKGRPIVWGKVVVAVRKSDYLPVWQKYYDESGKLMRIMNFKNITIMDGRKIPAVMELIPQNKEGHKTVVEYIEMDFNADVNESMFTMRKLKAPVRGE